MMEKGELEAKLVDLISENIVEAKPGFGASSDLFEAGLDSMGIMQLLVLIEGEFGIVIPVESVSRENIQTASAISVLMMREHGSAA